MKKKKEKEEKKAIRSRHRGETCYTNTRRITFISGIYLHGTLCVELGNPVHGCTCTSIHTCIHIYIEGGNKESALATSNAALKSTLARRGAM